MNKIWLGTNWKMHKTLDEGIKYSKQLIEATKDINENIQFFIIPPSTSLWPIKDVIGDSGIKLGAQSSHWEDQGAYTGEISPMMLAEIGIDIVELGFRKEGSTIMKMTRISIKRPMQCSSTV
jgi:triosephosphate isomerase